ncbi:organomercurial lyase [Streptomyces sp. AK02-04a]|nr:organomercurial lyase [Streptomyces sp. AK02-04a]
MPVTPAGLAQATPAGFPAVLGHTAQVTSPCQAAGDPVRLTATPDGPTNVEPATAVVSIVTPDARTMVLPRLHRHCGDPHMPPQTP